MNKRLSRAGFSIIEVMVAVAVFGIILVISTSAVGNSLRMTRYAQLDAQSQAFAKSYLDTVKASWTLNKNYQTDQLATTNASPTVQVPYAPPTGYTYTASVYSFNPTTGVSTLLNQYTYAAGVLPTPNVKPVGPILLKTVKLEVKQISSNRISSFSVRVAFSGDIAW